MSRSFAMILNVIGLYAIAAVLAGAFAAQLSLGEVAAVGATSLPVMLGTLAVCLLLAALVGRSSEGLRQLQTGFARSYALSMLAGAALVVAVILAVQLW